MIKSCEPLRQQLLRYFPQLFFLHMINVVVRQLFPTIACIKLSADSGHCLIQQEADGSGSPFLRRADKGAEKDIRQRVKPLVVMMSVETMPGSAALTVIPFSRRRSESSIVNSIKASFVLL